MNSLSPVTRIVRMMEGRETPSDALQAAVDADPIASALWGAGVDMLAVKGAPVNWSAIIALIVQLLPSILPLL